MAVISMRQEMISHFIELLEVEDTNGLLSGEIVTVSDVTILKPLYDEPYTPNLDVDDYRLASKCKRIRREARGW